MKWKSTLAYLLVLVIVAAAYAVLDSRKKEADRVDKESKRIIVFDEPSVNEIEIRSGNSAPIHLVRTGDWRMTAPITADVDSPVLTGFLNTLQDAERERKIEVEPANPAAFGLDKPSLSIRLLTAGGKWLELQAGAKNPAETSRYAKIGDAPDVFLISTATYDSLNRNMKDFRKKELFGWQSDQVCGVAVKWRTGEELVLEDAKSGDPRWKSSSSPGITLKDKKVQNLLDELHWLRAVDFIPDDAMPKSPLVNITFKLKDGRTCELKVADADQSKKQAAAFSSEIGAVLIPAHILQEIPKTAETLADRSLMPLEASDVVQLSWRTGDASGNLVRIDTKTWGTKEGEAAPKPLDDSLRVKGLLAYLQSVEYMEKVEDSSNPPEGSPNSVQLTDAVGKKCSLVWNWLPPESANPVLVRIEKDGSAKTVKAGYEDIKRLGVMLARMTAEEKAKH